MDKAKNEHLAILECLPLKLSQISQRDELLRDHILCLDNADKGNILGAKESLLASFPTLPN